MYHITTEQIEAFLALSQTKNYREVSEMLFITQPTVTKYIQRLEKELGIVLFNRNTQGVELTEAGALLFDTWAPIYRRFQESIAEIQQSALARNDQLNISFLRDYYGLISPRELAEKFDDYLAEHNLPPVFLSFRFLSMKEQRDALQNHHVDFSFSLGFDYDNLRSVQTETLVRRRIFALLPLSHPLARREEISIHELAEETFLVLSPQESFSANSVSSTMLRSFFKQPKTRIMTNLQSLTYALTRGDFVALGNKCFFRESIVDNFVEIPITELKNAGYEETLAYPAWDHSKNKQLFLDFLHNFYKE